MSRSAFPQQVFQSALLLATAFSVPLLLAAPSGALAQGAAATPSSRSIVELPAPRIEDYWISATLQPGGTVVFDGYAPDEATRSWLGEVGGADVTWLKLGSGAPPLYQTGVQFGLKALDHMGEGRFALRQNIVTLSGTARSGYDHDLLTESLAGLPEGLVLARAEIALPEPVRYSWSASKSVAGKIVLSGFVPTEDLGREALSHAGTAATLQTNIAPGAPSGFGENILAGIDALALLRSGTARFDGTTWNLAGELLPQNSSATVTAALSSGRIPAASWSVQLSEAPAPEPVPAPPAAAKPEPATPPAEPVEPVPSAILSEPLKPQDPAPAPVEPAAPAVPPSAPLPVTPSPSKPAPQAPARAAATVDLSACRATLEEFSARNSILFAAGAALIDPESGAALDELAQDLADCPTAMVYVEGYTDSDGDERANLALSVARAEAVVDALILRRVSPDRLYAVGYGEANPVADNSTSAGRRLNRRIVVTIPD